MKGLTIAIVLICILFLMGFTNPSSDDYEDYLQQKFFKEAKSDDELGGAFASILGGIAGTFVAQVTERRNYLFFSIYDTELGASDLVVLGILGNFVVLEAPEQDQ